MNIDSILKIFVPKDHSFIPLFENDAKNLLRASELLREMMSSSDQEEHERINKQIKEVEHVGDEITHEIFDQLNKSFITPFDREDIHELAGNIDDVLDAINGVSRRIILYKPKQFISQYKDLANLIYDASREIESSIHCLKDPAAHKKEIMDACNRVKYIEHHADEIYFDGASELFRVEEDPKELFKNNKILEILEKCVNQAEDVTDSLKTILIKMA